ncbi:hypothetical protein CP082626L3_1071B, partial [Chlamydia psittaci 08-2626_L3]
LPLLTQELMDSLELHKAKHQDDLYG